MRICICYTSDKKMKEINVNGVKYFIQDKEDEIGLIHELLSKGYTIKQIANLLGISERKVKKFMEDCW